MRPDLLAETMAGGNGESAVVDTESCDLHSHRLERAQEIVRAYRSTQPGAVADGQALALRIVETLEALAAGLPDHQPVEATPVEAAPAGNDILPARQPPRRRAHVEIARLRQRRRKRSSAGLALRAAVRPAPDRRAGGPKGDGFRR